MTIFQKIWSNWKFLKGACKKCPLIHKKLSAHPFYGMGNWSSDVAVVAASPAYNLQQPDDIKHSDFKEVSINFLLNRLSDRKNQLIKVLRTLTKDSSMSVEDLYFTNVRKCNADLSDHELTKARKICKTYIKEEIEAVRPQLIITFGTKAVKAICDVYNCKFNCKQAMWNQSVKTLPNGRKLLAFPHWGYIMRQPLEERKAYWNNLPKLFKRAVESTAGKNSKLDFYLKRGEKNE